MRLNREGIIEQLRNYGQVQEYTIIPPGRMGQDTPKMYSRYQRVHFMDLLSWFYDVIGWFLLFSALYPGLFPREAGSFVIDK